MHWLKPGALCGGLLWAVTAAGLAAEEPAPFDWGPLVSRRQDVHGTWRLRALGPLFERASGPDGQQLTALRPLYSRSTHSGEDRRRSDYLWPVGFTRRIGTDHHGRLLLAFWTRYDINDPESRYHLYIIPFYFQGRDADGESYAAIFPLGGRIHDFLRHDTIRFYAWPLYVRTEQDEIVSRSYLWPFVSHTSGKGIHRFRVVPFYGQNRHRDRYHKRFIMWPIWTEAEYFCPGSSGSGYILFPLYGRLDLEDQRSRMVLPPLFRVSRGDRVNLTLAPWPIFQRRTGEVRQTYVWPFYGQKRMPVVQSRFVAWPIYHEERIDRGDYIAQRRYVLPFYYSQLDRDREAAPPPREPDDPVPRGELRANYQKIWPVMSYERQEEASRLRVLALWPQRRAGPIERNYAPLWTLFQHTRVDEATETELLWGLYRRERDGEEQAYTSLFPLVNWERDESGDEPVRRWSLLKGLLGYERHGMNQRYRLLYLLRWGDTEESEP